MTSFSRRTLLRSSFACGSLFRGALGGQGTGQASPVIETEDGKVRGTIIDGVRVFKGIPYGAPTEGAGRFLPSVKPRKWSGARECTGVPPRCIQSPGSVFSISIGDYFSGGRRDKLRLDEQKDSENCLFLNILAPESRTGTRCPVMIYIHGGGFTSGSGIIALAADAFPREQDVVLVSVNHRLNAFGYLYLGAISEKYADSGNVGMLDLIAALAWVRDNIGSFGGDPNNVTIFGESGGGAKISALLAMPAAKGLFHKAIVESGSALRVATKDEASRTTQTVLEKLGISAKQVNALARIEGSKLYAATLPNISGADGAAIRFGPVGDGRSLPQQTWDPQAPALSAQIPMIIGSCKDESTLFMGGKNQENFTLDESGMRLALKNYLKLHDSDLTALIDTFRKDRSAASPSDIFFAIASNRMFRTNAILQAERKAAQAKAPVYMYFFTYDTPMENGRLKAFHTAELPLVLRLVKYPETEQLSRQLSGAWAAFARHGDPNHGALPRWPAYTRERRATMLFNLKSSVVDDPGHEERVAMQRLYPSGAPM